MQPVAGFAKRLKAGQNKVKNRPNAGFCIAIRRSSAESPALREMQMTIFA
jgi:hypothetical protein